MSFFEDASIVLIPSGIKNQKIYSVKPTDGTGDLTFTRASSATRVQSDGLIEKVRTNLILQSQTFQTTWAPVRASVSADTTTAPDGTNTADTLFDSVDANIHYIQQNFSALTGPATISVFAKANQLSQIQLVAAGGTTAMGRGFDLSTGTTFVESVGGVVSNDLGQSITAVGNGWYRCTMSWTSTGQNDFWLLTSVGGAATFTGTGTNGVFIWGAQLETGDIATDYIATTTAAVSVGPVSGLPRLDYLGSTCPRLLLEPQRTNLAQYSEQFDNVFWGKTAGTTLTANTTISPSGYQDADTAVFVLDTDSINKVIATGISVVSGTAYTFSVFTKTTTQAVFFGGATTGTGTNVYNGAVDYGNGWYRQSITRTWSASGTIQIQNTISLLAASGTLQIWGAQLEVGAYATSYIPTLGASVTRVADFVNKTSISGLIGATEGTLYAEAKVTLNGRLLLIGAAGNFIEVLTTSAGKVNAFVRTSVTEADILSTSTYATGDTLKVAFAYKQNDFALYVNGTAQGTDTSGNVPTGMAQLIVNDYLSAGFSSANAYSQLLLFKTRLTNDQLAELTA